MVLPVLPWEAVFAWPGPEVKVVLCAVLEPAMSFSGCDLRRLEPMWSFSLIFSIVYWVCEGL